MALEVASPITQLETALADVLTADADLVAWAVGGIHRVIDPPVVAAGLVPDVPWPAILVSTDRQSFEWRISRELSMSLDLVVWMLWEEQRGTSLAPRVTLNPDEWDPTSLVFGVLRAIEGNKLLAVARYADAPLARNYLGPGSVSYNAIPRESLTDEEIRIANEVGWPAEMLTGRQLEIPVRWEITLSRPGLVNASS